MRMKRTMRSSSSTTRTRRRSNSSGISLPHKADDLLFLGAFNDLDQRQPVDRPDHLDDIPFQVVQVLAVPLARVADNQDGVCRLRQLVDLAHHGHIAGKMEHNCIWHRSLPPGTHWAL